MSTHWVGGGACHGRFIFGSKRQHGHGGSLRVRQSTQWLDGLGHAQSCRECHQNPVTGSTSQVKELRAGHNDANGNFFTATATVADGTVTIANRSLINQRAICPAVDTITVDGQPQTYNFPQTQGQERISTAETIRAFRMSLNTLGDGFIESIADQTLLNLA